MPQDFYDQVRAAKLAAEQATKDRALQAKLWKEKEARECKEAVPRLHKLSSLVKERARELTSILTGVAIELTQDGSDRRKSCTIEINYKKTRANTLGEWYTRINMELVFRGPADGPPERLDRFTVRTNCTQSVITNTDEHILQICEAYLQSQILDLVRNHPECVK